MATPAQPSLHSKEDHLARLKDGRNAWNTWIKGLSEDDRKKIDLSEFDLSGTDLSQYDLRLANLTEANLTRTTALTTSFEEARLVGADLSGGDFSESTFNRAVLFGANLQGADLQQVTFKGTNLEAANLRKSNLQGADMTAIKGGLLPWQLAGAVLTGAKLPAPVEKLYEKLGMVSEISESAKKLFLGLLAGCLYCWLTIATTKDVDLITNRASSPLPIIQTAIPIVGFYVVAPIILLCIYFYFHFYLQKLWEELSQLPAIFPDGKPLYQRADPWLFNDLVRAHFPRLKQGRPFLSMFQSGVSILLAWWLVPITLRAIA